jgi:hypothetical protein
MGDLVKGKMEHKSSLMPVIVTYIRWPYLSQGMNEDQMALFVARNE